MSRLSAPPARLHLRRGDLVVVLSGNDRGTRGRVLAVDRQARRVTVEGVNLVTRHVRPNAKRTPVGRVEQPSAIASANVQLICSHCSRPTRRTITSSEGRRTATCRRCHESLAAVKEQA